jgi:UDPglucose 6-dehydrogenase
VDNACIVGYGIVGKATALAFGIRNHYDINGDSTITLFDAANFRYVFLCLPTPTIDGKCDVSAIRDTIKEIESIKKNPIYIIRSTTIPGTARALMEEFGMDRIVSNPEFLTESTWELDAKRPDMAIIGGENPSYIAEVKAIYDARYKYLTVRSTNTITAEMVKYAFNTFFATKVVFANEIYDTCQEVGANYSVVRELLMAHPWGSSHHFFVEHKGGRGAKGKCLPKDLEAFATFSGSKLLQTVKEINDRFGNRK